MQAKLLYLAIPSYYVKINMATYVSSLSGITVDLKLKEDTGLENPVFLLNKSLTAVTGYNYIQLTVGTNKYRYYYVKDFVSVANNLTEIIGTYDALRSNKFLSYTSGKLLYTNNVNDWVGSLDDTRFEPHKTEQYKGMHFQDMIETGIPAVNDGKEPTGQYGIYLVKFWWGAPATIDGVTSNKGIAYAMMNYANFQSFTYQVAHYIQQNWGSVFSGVTDFTKFIISAKYFPGIMINTVGSITGAADMAGYGFTQQVTLGGIATIDIDCYVRFNNASFLDGGNQVVGLSALGTATDMSTVNKMDFLVSPRWCNVVVTTPVGFTSLPLGSVTNGCMLRHRSIIDLETGIMSVLIAKQAGYLQGDYHSEPITILKNTVFVDAMQAFTYIQSQGENVARSVLNSASSIGIGAIAGGPIGAATTGASAVFNGFMTPRQVSVATSSFSNDLIEFIKNQSTYSPKWLTIKSYIYLNEETPIWDPHTYAAQPTTQWNARYLQENYINWCSQVGHGFPSNKHKEISACLKSSGSTYLRFSEIDDILVEDGFVTPEAEAAIRSALLSGIVVS